MIPMLTPDTTLGAYRLIQQIGTGGMGEVWKAEDPRLGRIVAIKILPPAIAADAEATARLRREARTIAQLNHPNIATIHSIEEADGRLFIVMEFIDGEPLGDLIYVESGAMSPTRSPMRTRKASSTATSSRTTSSSPDSG